MKRFISLSGGVESSTMSILYGKGATAIWCDTGAEHKEMYERMDFLEMALTDFHKGDFQLLRIKPQPKIKGEFVNNLIDGIKRFCFMPSPRKRYCTSRFKIEPIENFLKTQGECELLIGLNEDENPDNFERTGNWMKLKNVKYRYPLIEDGLDRNDCEEVLTENAMHPNFPVYMSRGGCYMCFYKSKAEYKAMYILDKETFNKTRDLEEGLQDRRKKFFSILGDGTKMEDLANECERELSLWGADKVIEFYKPLAKTKVCGAFCHR
jgi:3'-phosphoadenosine 5'-phosphosulfate sulfotransferase (PAPS reductase)/FAD synthetase